MGRADTLMPWVVEALEELGGKGSVLDVSKVVWSKHEAELSASGDLFYTWQYDMRWAAQRLREAGTLAAVARRRDKEWQLADAADGRIDSDDRARELRPGET